MSHPEICEIPGCENPAMVGWGKVVVWICLYHFEEALGETRRRIEQLRGKPRPADAERLHSQP